jgi:hypothetical protein
MINAGQDPSLLVKKLATEEEQVKAKIVDPLEEKLMALENENLIAFLIAEKGYDTVYNIGHNWTYDMVQECLTYVNILSEEELNAHRKSERNSE